MTVDQNENLGFFKKSQNAGIPYFHVFDNSLCQKSKTEIDGWEGPIETTHPKTKEKVQTWVMRYDPIVAYIIDVEQFKKEFTPEQGGGRASGLELTLAAGTMRGILTLKWGQNGPDPVLKRFLKVAPNINFEKPVSISVFKNNDGKQAVAFYQGDDPDPRKWDKVTEYWRRPVDPVTNKYNITDAAVGADGSVLPQPIHNDFDDTWDYKGQSIFLMKYFIEMVMPKIKVIAARHNITPRNEMESVDPTHTGTPSAEIPVVTEKPEVVTYSNMADAATGAQRAEIKSLSVTANFDFEAKCESAIGCKFDEMNKHAASFAIYKLKEMIAKNGATVPQAAAAPQAPVAAPPAPVAVPTAPEEPSFGFGDDDGWGAAPVPNAPTDEAF